MFAVLIGSHLTTPELPACRLTRSRASRQLLQLARDLAHPFRAIIRLEGQAVVNQVASSGGASALCFDTGSRRSVHAFASNPTPSAIGPVGGSRRNVTRRYIVAPKLKMSVRSLTSLFLTGLRGHVLRRALHAVLRLALDPGQAEVDDLHLAGSAEHDVVRLQVGVADTCGGACGPAPAAILCEDLHELRQRQQRHLVERLAVDVLDEQVRPSGLRKNQSRCSSSA